jgi:hypothetical protein
MDGYTLVAVPNHLVPQVTEFITQQPAKGAPDGSGPAGEQPGTLVRGWSEDLVVRAYKESGDPMRELLRFLAAHADQEVTSVDIAEGIGVKDWNSVAGMLGAFGRRCSNRYGMEHFPWEHRWDEHGRGRMKMPASVAQVIESIA